MFLAFFPFSKNLPRCSRVPESPPGPAHTAGNRDLRSFGQPPPARIYTAYHLVISHNDSIAQEEEKSIGFQHFRKDTELFQSICILQLNNLCLLLFFRINRFENFALKSFIYYLLNECRINDIIQTFLYIGKRLGKKSMPDGYCRMIKQRADYYYGHNPVRNASEY